MKEGASAPSQLSLPHASAEELHTRLQTNGLWTPLVERALSQAVDSHSLKTRDSGNPYLEEHIYPVTLEVMGYMLDRGKSQERQETAVVATILHDTVEEDPSFEIEHCQRTYGRAVSRLVYPLTKYGIDKDIYVAKLGNAPKDARRVKLFDRINNLLCSIVLIEDQTDKTRRYVHDTEQNYMPIARSLVDRYFAERLGNLVNLGKVALDQYDLAAEAAA
jgi:(p)ppGpp synthase/HD superfamily hydrolase